MSSHIEVAASSSTLPNPLAASIAAANGVIAKYKEKFAEMDEVRQKQAAEIQHLYEEIAKCEGKAAPQPHTYVPLSQLFEVAKTTQDASIPKENIEAKVAAVKKIFAIYKMVLVNLRDIQAKQQNEIINLSEALKAASNPLHHITPELAAICRGNLEMLLENAQAVPAITLLEALLQKAPEEAEAIYNLALFIAAVNPNKLRINDPLYEKLREWILVRASNGELLSHKRLQLLLALGQTVNGIPKDLIDPIEVFEHLELLIKDISEDYVGKTRELLAKTDKTRAEVLFCALVKNELEKIQNAPELENPDNLDTTLSLFAQLRDNPQFSNTIATTRAIGATWQDRRTARALTIHDCIQQCCNSTSLRDQVLSARPAGEVDNQTPIPKLDTRFVETLATRVSKGPIPEGQRADVLDKIEEEIYNTCKTLTHLEAGNPKQFARKFCQLFAEGKLPLAFWQILVQGDGQYALYLAHLVYYHEAIAHVKPQFAGFASHHAWGWLTGGRLAPAEGAFRMQQLIQAFHDDRNFIGSAMVPKQVCWASHLADLMMRGKVSPIYSDAGSGKTSTAIFTMRLLQKVLPDICRDKDVHLLSPFYSCVQGLYCHQLTNPNGTFYIDIASDTHLQDVVLVDEAHILDPNIKIVLRSPSGKTREVEPLPMTATPVIPRDEYEAFRKQLHLRLKEKHAKLSCEYASLCERFEQTKAEVASKQISAITSNIQKNNLAFNQYINHLPLAQRKFFQQHLNNLNGNAFTDNDIKMLIISMNWFLRAGEAGEHVYGTKDLDTLTKTIPKGFDPLQSLETDKFARAKKLFIQLDADLRNIQRLRKGQEIVLSDELAEEAAILGGMKKHLDDLQNKLNKWAHEDALPSTDDGDEILRTLPQKRHDKFKMIAYSQKTLSRFSPEKAAELAAALPNPEQSVIQLIYPGVRFTSDNFEALIRQLYPVMAQKYPNKDLFFAYQDSHSADDKKGKKLAVRLQNDNLVFAPLSHEFDQMTQAAVLLYDATNKQGGDFNSLSRVTDSLEIAQVVFYNLTDDPEANPLNYTSANDLYQALSRRRGISKVPAQVVGTAPQATFFNIVNRRQWDLEKAWGARNAAGRIAKKLLKAYGQKKIPQQMPDLRHRTLDVVHGKISQELQGLGTVHLIDALRTALLKMPSQEATQPQAFKEYVESVPLKALIEEVISQASQDDLKQIVVIPAADHIANWRLRKLQSEISCLMQSIVQYQPVIIADSLQQA